MMAAGRQRRRERVGELAQPVEQVDRTLLRGGLIKRKLLERRQQLARAFEVAFNQAVGFFAGGEEGFEIGTLE